MSLLKASLVGHSVGSHTRVKWLTLFLWPNQDGSHSNSTVIRAQNLLSLTKLARRILHKLGVPDIQGGVTYLWDDLTPRTNYPRIVGSGSIK